MALLVYKFSNYENTAEREQYRSLCKKLKSYYAKKDEICIFIANYNIYDCELDGIIIKQDAIIAIEFKNYKGEVIAVDNGHWKLSDGTIIKGGSRKTVYQQANLNHVAIKRGFKDGDVLPAKKVKDVSALVVFHQAITLVNNLTPRTQSWLHVCDETNFIAKVQDITSRSTDLSVQDMLRVIEKLNLTDDYLDLAYSNKDFFENLPVIEDELKEEEQQNVIVDEVNEPLDSEAANQETNTEPAIEPEIIGKSIPTFDNSEQKGMLAKFAREIVQTLCPNNELSVSVFRHDEVSTYIPSIKMKRDFLVLIQGKIPEGLSNTLPVFLGKHVHVFDQMLYWEEGDTISKVESDHYPESEIRQPESRDMINVSATSDMPHWLDNYIFNLLDARYKPDHVRHEYNLDLDKEELLTYLGTYFPRSYSEAINIFAEISQKTSVFESLFSNRDSINILDFGCGSGGEIFGTLSYIERNYPNVKNINILAIDGNQGALRLFEKVMSEYMRHTEINIIYNIGPVFVESQDDLMLMSSILAKKFDIIVSFKAICEMVSKERVEGNAYSFIARLLSEQLSSSGVLIIEDVTIKNNRLGVFLPNYMNDGINEFINNSNGKYKSILPLCCNNNERTCAQGCFRKVVFETSHSRKQQDVSKVFYRVITKNNN